MLISLLRSYLAPYRRLISAVVVLSLIAKVMLKAPPVPDVPLPISVCLSQYMPPYTSIV